MTFREAGDDAQVGLDNTRTSVFNTSLALRTAVLARLTSTYLTSIGVS